MRPLLPTRDHRRLGETPASAGDSPAATPAWAARSGLIVVICLFCVPLFVGLRGWDLRNDEAIYSYAVDRILETGDWLTPRGMPDDGPFLEKPPLKFWMVAAGIRAGLLPHDEFGLRLFDALFGAISFVYVFLLGLRLSGPLAGVVSGLVLFTIDPLLFAHGLRENNMEASLVLAYCGGIYHFVRWVEGDTKRPRVVDGLAVATFFVLGFMTKFVAALFLPVVCAVALWWRSGARADRPARGREWVPAAVLVLATTAPWFTYQALRDGRALWQTMFGQHVYTRFTGALDPSHLQPWHYYYTQLWQELTLAGSAWISALGLLLLAHRAWTERPWVARLVLVWWALPFALMSMGTSKMFHYAFPFLPPIALGAGLAASTIVRAIEHGIASVVPAWLRRVPPVPPTHAQSWLSLGWARRSVVPQVFVVGAALALAIAVWTAVAGPIRWDLNGVSVLRNSSVVRPLLVAVALFSFTGQVRAVATTVALGLGVVLLPLAAYPRALERTVTIARPLRALRDCAVGLDASSRGTHVYTPSAQISNSYYYYLRRVGPWSDHAGSPRDDEMERRLFDPVERTIAIVLRADYERFSTQLGPQRMSRSGFTLADLNPELVLTPGPFEECGAAAVRAGAAEVRGPATGALPTERR